MRYSRQAASVLLLTWAFSSCAGDDKKRAARGDEAGAAGESSLDAGGSSASAGAPSVEGGTSPQTIGGAPSQTDGGVPAQTDGGVPAQTDGGAPGGTPITINGVVVASNEQPVSGVTVEVQGQSVVTGDDGTFSFEATAPYDLVVRGGEVGGQENTEAYLDVTRPDPKVYRSFVEEDRQGGISGVLSGGGGFPVAANRRVHLSFWGPALATFYNLLNSGASASYNSSGDPYWLRTASLAGYLFGIEVDATTGAILATGSKAVTLVDQSTVGSPEGDLTLAAAQLKDFTIALNKPAELTLNQFFVSVGFHQIQQAIPTGDLTVQVPSDLPDPVSIIVSSYGNVSGGFAQTIYRVPGSSSSLDMAWTSPPVISAPNDNAQLGPGASFTYVKPASTVAVLSFGYTVFDPNTEAETSYYTNVYTDASSVTLARLLALDLDLPPGETLDFSMTTDALEPTLDAFVAPEVRRFANDIKASAASRSVTRAF